MYCSPNIVREIKSRRLRWAHRVARTGDDRNVFKILTGKSTGKRPFGRSNYMAYGTQRFNAAFTRALQ